MPPLHTPPGAAVTSAYETLSTLLHAPRGEPLDVERPTDPFRPIEL